MSLSSGISEENILLSFLFFYIVEIQLKLLKNIQRGQFAYLEGRCYSLQSTVYNSSQD